MPLEVELGMLGGTYRPLEPRTLTAGATLDGTAAYLRLRQSDRATTPSGHNCLICLLRDGRNIRWPEFELVTDFQLQVEHSVDLEGRDLALFITQRVLSEPISVFPFNRRQDARYTTHEMSPQAVLHVYEQVYQRRPPLIPAVRLRGKASNWRTAEPGGGENRDAALACWYIVFQPNVKVWQTLLLHA